MNKVYRVRKLTKAQADSIEEITFGNKETAAGQVAVKYLNEETMATLQVGYDTLRGMLCAGAEQFVDWSAAYRLFANERINKDALFAPVRNTVAQRLQPDEPMVVMMDDTLVRKRGRKIPGTGWKRDPLGPHFCTNLVRSQLLTSALECSANDND